MSNTRKVSMNLSNEAIATLKELADKRGVTMTEVLRHAIGTEKFLDDVTSKKGEVLIKDKQGKIDRVVFR